MSADGDRRPSEQETEAPPGRQRHGGTDDDPLGLDDPAPPATPDPWRWIGLCTFVLLSIALLATMLVTTAARDKRTTLLEAEERRLQESVRGRVNMLQTWLQAQHAASRRLVNSQVFRLFVTELALQNGGAPLPRSLRDQRPYFRQLVTDFTRQNELLRAAVLRDDGRILLGGPGPAFDVRELLSEVGRAPAGWKLRPSPIRSIGIGDPTFVVDILMPLPPVQAGDEPGTKPRIFLVLTSPIERAAVEALSNPVAAPSDEPITLLQRRDGEIERFGLVSGRLERRESLTPEVINPGQPIPFDRYGSDAEAVYGFGLPLAGTPWSLHHAVDAGKALAPVRTFVAAAAGLSTIVVIALAASFAAAWWRRGRDHHFELLGLYRAQASNLDRRQRFLQAITRSIGDWLTVSAPDGRLIYANPAFASVLPGTSAPVLGKTWNELVAEAPGEDDAAAGLADLVRDAPFTRIALGDEHRIVSIQSFDLKSGAGDLEGTIRVVRDHTRTAAERRRYTRAIAQTVEAFVHAIELRDPFLVGHTHRVRRHVIAIGRRLTMANDDVASLALAASLSQIGKIFVPDVVLAKPDRHEGEEIGIMRDHIRHAVEILERIDFDLPVVDIVGQMYERLDGSGYPKGLQDEAIGLPARILGVSDVYCARTAPRSYRERMSPGKALYHLAGNGHRYDLEVVSALSEIVGDNGSGADDDGVEGGFIDSAIWQRKHGGELALHERAG